MSLASFVTSKEDPESIFQIVEKVGVGDGAAQMLLARCHVTKCPASFTHIQSIPIAPVPILSYCRRSVKG